MISLSVYIDFHNGRGVKVFKDHVFGCVCVCLQVCKVARGQPQMSFIEFPPLLFVFCNKVFTVLEFTK